MDRLDSSTFIFWLDDPRLSIHAAVDYYFQTGYSEVATMQHISHFLVLKNYFMAFLNPDRWETPKSEVAKLRQAAAQCTNFDELDDLRGKLIKLGIDPIEPDAW